MKYSAVIVAAGEGTRMGLGYNKVYYHLGEVTILEKTMKVFLTDPECVQIVVVTDPDLYYKNINLSPDQQITVVRGGSTRQESVGNGLNAVTQEYVLIHDGARPYLSRDVLSAVKKGLETDDAVCVMVPCKDTIKRVIDGVIEETYERSSLMAAQTPQAFRTDLIVSCMNRARQEGFTATDDSALAEKYGDVKVKAVMGSYENIKITTPEDL